VRDARQTTHYIISMHAFAGLLDHLLLSPRRSVKLQILADYFKATPDPERGYALGVIAGEVRIAAARPSALRALAASRIDPELFALSYDFVGDLAETVALIWPAAATNQAPPHLTDVVEALQDATPAAAIALIPAWLDALSATDRWALLKICTGGLRIGAGARLVKQALADWGHQPVADIEEVWPGLSPPYRDLFAWLEGRAPRPEPRPGARFRPAMLAHPFDKEASDALDPADFAIEWKWDGVRVQAVRHGAERRLFTRNGDDITAAFPDLAEALAFEGVLDGELLVRDSDGQPARFAVLQKRLNRKNPDRKLMAASPAFMRCYDVLVDGRRDVRALQLRERRSVLEAITASAGPRIDLSPLVVAPDWASLQSLRARPPHPAIEGLMLKRWDSPYVAGRPTGLWWKWKQAAKTVDCVLMYAQRGHGKRSAMFSDFTFGCWDKDGRLSPVGKAYFGFTDAELKELDAFVRANTVERFGPVRGVRAEPDHGVVLEIAFDGLSPSNRHRSGIAMRFPRIARIRWDKPPREADTLAQLAALME
jgi:DNA ligase-1